MILENKVLSQFQLDLEKQGIKAKNDLVKTKIICWQDRRKIKNNRKIFIDWYTAIDLPEVAFMKNLQLSSQQNIY